ncbi:MAG: glutathione ABC transporter substrate-binding protein [Chloroflexota bacterium]|nr:glutathione ABC transporter substrate-binding protein [Chloroflexota bacterium]
MSSNGRRVSRRDFLRATGLAVGATALAACAPAAPASVGPAEAGAPAAAGATTEIVVAQYADVVNLDPQDTNDNASYGPEKLMYEGLVGYNAAMEMEAQLAERWEASDDATEFTFFLRQGINFHDGTPFNAEAVKYNFERVINPDNALKRYGLYNIIASVEVIDEYTVKFTTTKPFGAMLATFAHPAGGIISPTAAAQYSDVHEFGKNPVGTGPFKFVEWVPGDHLTVEKFDGYWNSDAAAQVDRITIKPVPEAGTRIAMLLAGDAHFINQVPPSQVELVVGGEDVALAENESIYTYWVAMNTQIEPFNNKQVRQALNHAVDKQAIIDVVLRGYGKITDSPIAPRVWGYTPVMIYEYDPEKAKQMLADAGYPDGFSTTMWISDSSEAKEAAIAMQGQLAEVGVQVEVVPMEAATLSAERFKPAAENQSQMNYAGWSPSTGDADWAIRPLLATESIPPTSFNLAFFSDPDVDAAVAEGLASADPEVRQAAYAQAQEAIMDEAPWIFLWVPTTLGGIRKEVGGMLIQGDGIAYMRTAHFVE